MDPISSKTALAAAGAGEDALYVDDVFSTYVYKGNATARSINNGVDLSSAGGLVWIKNRDDTTNHNLTDTERGAIENLAANDTLAESESSRVTGFLSNGFSLSDNGIVNANNQSYVSWSFRKAPGFFDVVTYTGTGSVRNISHNLGSTPGMIIVKQTSSTESWGVYHRSLAASETVLLSGTNMAFSSPNSWNSTAPTDSVFTVGTEARVNQNGQTYVAYLFAHNDQSFGTDSDEAIVHCGTFNGGGVLNSNTIEVNTGFEPQWVLIKRTDTTSDWYIFDTMRGMDNDGNNDKALFPNDANAEGSPQRLWAYQNGFAFDEDLGGSSAEWIYMAIRRPNKPPEAATDVFAIDNQGTGTMPPQYHSNFPVDWALTVAFAESQTYRYRESFTRLMGKKRMKLNTSEVESNYNSVGWDYMDGFHNNNSSVSTTYSWMFKRAPGFFDVVAWSGDGSSNRAITHSLGVTPELLITKRRAGNDGWWSQYTGIFGTNTGIRLDQSSGLSTGVSAFTGTSAATSSVFYVGSDSSINGSSDNYVAYLFATLDGISKVGTYTGTGSDINVDCGFTAGARFVLIKRTDSTGDWYVWDSTRGIVSGNDPYFLLNTDDADVTNTDYIDPLNAGFTVTSSAPAALNTSGGTYMFLAIA